MYVSQNTYIFLPPCIFPCTEGRVLSGAVAGMGALDVNSSDDEEDGEEGGVERMMGGDEVCVL